MATVVDSGTQSATAAHDLGSATTTAGIYVCRWNLTAMVDGNIVRCAVKAKVLSGDTAEMAFSGYYAHANGGGDPIVQSPPVVSYAPSGSPSFQCYVEEIGAATISIPWELVKLD